MQALKLDVISVIRLPSKYSATAKAMREQPQIAIMQLHKKVCSFHNSNRNSGDVCTMILIEFPIYYYHKLFIMQFNPNKILFVEKTPVLD